MTDQTAFDRVVSAFERSGLAVALRGDGLAACQAPGHSAADRSISLRAIEGQVLLNSHADDKDQVLGALGLTMADLFDNVRGADYRYSDGRIVHRSPAKKFRQTGNTKGTALFRAERLPATSDTPIYVVEGEKDVLALESVGAVAVCSAMGAGKAHLFDWTPLHDRTVIVVQDKDTPGRAHARQIVELLDGNAAVSIVEAKSGKDAADHIADGHQISELITVDEPRSPGRKLRVVRGSDVRTRRVQWWEPDLIPCSSLTLLAGREGLGKSTVACSWAARETNTGNTIMYLHSEDSREHTVAPRLKAAGADMANVIFVDVATEYTDTGNVILPLDTAAIEQVIVEHNVTFMVLDAATSSMSSELSGRDDREVRRFLEPLTQLAARRNLVILGLVHFGKRDGNDTGKLILGSIAWSQVARSVLSLAKDDDSGDLVLTGTKSNLASRTRSVSLRLHSATVITDDGHAEVGAAQWLGDTDRDARELLAPPELADDDRDDRTAAEHWLADYLQQNGQTPAKTVKSDGAKEKISERTLKRAASKIGVIFESKGFPRTSHWSLPQSGQPTPYTGERGPTGPTGPDQAKQNGPTETKSQSGHTPVHGPTGGPTAISDSQAACVACSAELPDALVTVELCPVCTAAVGYIERTLDKISIATKTDLLHACSSSDGSRAALNGVLDYAITSGRVEAVTVGGRRKYTRPEQQTVQTPGRSTGQWLASGQPVRKDTTGQPTRHSEAVG